MSTKNFVFEKVVYLGDTNAEGNVYFAKYFDWQGQAREAFVKDQIPNIVDLMKSGLILITCEAYNNFIKPSFLFDHIDIEINTYNIKKASFVLVFSIKNKISGELLSKGWQKIAFFDGKSGKLFEMPDIFREKAMYFIIDKCENFKE